VLARSRRVVFSGDMGSECGISFLPTKFIFNHTAACLHHREANELSIDMRWWAVDRVVSAYYKHA
jgi:hypothetical protein